MGKEQILYRFKTKKELILEFGPTWRQETGWINRDDRLLGTIYPFITYKEDSSRNHFMLNCVFENMLKDITVELKRHKIESLIKKLKENDRKISKMGTME